MTARDSLQITMLKIDLSFLYNAIVSTEVVLLTVDLSRKLVDSMLNEGVSTSDAQKEYIASTIKMEKSGKDKKQNGDDTTKEETKQKDLDKVDDSYLKKKGIDAHQLKKDVYGKKAKIAEYDIYVNKKTGELYTQRKPQ